MYAGKAMIAIINDKNAHDNDAFIVLPVPFSNVHNIFSLMDTY